MRPPQPKLVRALALALSLAALHACADEHDQRGTQPDDAETGASDGAVDSAAGNQDTSTQPAHDAGPTAADASSAPDATVAIGKDVSADGAAPDATSSPDARADAEAGSPPSDGGSPDSSAADASLADAGPPTGSLGCLWTARAHNGAFTGKVYTPEGTATISGALVVTVDSARAITGTFTSDEAQAIRIAGTIAGAVRATSADAISDGAIDGTYRTFPTSSPLSIHGALSGTCASASLVSGTWSFQTSPESGITASGTWSAN